MQSIEIDKSDEYVPRTPSTTFAMRRRLKFKSGRALQTMFYGSNLNSLKVNLYYKCMTQPSQT
ncbi:unnamed protein product [Fusarium graminearum]|nr:unnamed protein product [Fusarium graminearum]